METIFMNVENSKTSDPHRISVNLLYKISNLSIYWTRKNIKKSCKNNKFKISTPS